VEEDRFATMKSLRIVFMGTPEFAVPSLEILARNNKNIVGVVTAEDKPQGRGLKAGISPVKETALKHRLKVLQPSKLKSPEFINELKALQADLQVVVAFRMLPEAVWAMPPKGTFNLHASLLPQYRGAAPINWAIINGEKETGVTTFFLQHEIDTGGVILQEKEPIKPDDDAGQLYERLMYKGAELVLKTVEAIERGDAKSIPQVNSGTLKVAPKIFKETCKINWSQSGDSIKNFVRGLSPYPGAWTEIGGAPIKIWKVREVKTFSDNWGEIKTDQSTYLHVQALDSGLAIEEFQPEGKKRMKVTDFFRGNKLGL
jgi:methionyl-tRNA formyltransferase